MKDTTHSTDSLLKWLDALLHPDSVYMSDNNILVIRPDALKAVRAQLLAGRECAKALEDGLRLHEYIKGANVDAAHPKNLATNIRRAIAAAKAAGVG